MTSYTVKWEIELEAEDAVDASLQALKIQRDTGSVATCFTVYDDDCGREEVDLMDIP